MNTAKAIGIVRDALGASADEGRQDTEALEVFGSILSRLRGLADEWDAAEQEANEYGPRSAYNGYDCAEMLRDALRA